MMSMCVFQFKFPRRTFSDYFSNLQEVKLAYNAQQQAGVVAANVLALVKGNTPPKVYKVRIPPFLLSPPLTSRPLSLGRRSRHLPHPRLESRYRSVDGLGIAGMSSFTSLLVVNRTDSCSLVTQSWFVTMMKSGSLRVDNYRDLFKVLAA
jgi:hypothetical protein